MREHLPSLPPPQEPIAMRMSNFSLPPRIVALGGVAQYRNVLDEIRAGHPQAYAGGYDLTPTRRLLLDRACGRFENLRRDKDGPQPAFATGVHQTWPCGAIENWRSKRGADAANLAFLAVMPERRSFGAMRRIAEAVGATTMTVYPGLCDKQGNLMSYGWCEDKAAVQLEPDAIRQMGAAYNMGVFFDNINERGAGRIVVDNHHITRMNAAQDFCLNWRGVLESVQENGVPIVGLHISAGRADARQVEERDQSMKDLRAILEEPENIGSREMGEIIARSCEIWRTQGSTGTPLYVTTEIPYKGLAQYTEGVVSREQFGDLHRAIESNLKMYVTTCLS